jgi:hypothetical protein
MRAASAEGHARGSPRTSTRSWVLRELRLAPRAAYGRGSPLSEGAARVRSVVDAARCRKLAPLLSSLRPAPRNPRAFGRLRSRPEERAARGRSCAASAGARRPSCFATHPAGGRDEPGVGAGSGKAARGIRGLRVPRVTRGPRHRPGITGHSRRWWALDSGPAPLQQMLVTRHHPVLLRASGAP